MRGLLRAKDLCLDTPGGRPLFRDLQIRLAAGDRVALVGRNGVGKSSLLSALAGVDSPAAGSVLCEGNRLLVPQRLPDPEGAMAGSPGELRRRWLDRAREARPDLLLLDEPTHDLDGPNIDWLRRWLGRWQGALIVVSHDRRLLRLFDEFFVVAESGCRHFSGSFDALTTDLARETDEEEARYVRNLNRLSEKEKRNDRVRRRRQRKKNLGRLHETGRCPSRAKLNENRSYAQESQGKRAALQKQRVGAAREWARATRTAMTVKLPLEVVLPRLPAVTTPVASLVAVAARVGDRVLFEGVSLCIDRQRIAIDGPNGSGKSALVEILVGDRSPSSGRATREVSRIGYIAQNCRNWCREESLVDILLSHGELSSAEEVARALRAHRFPFALAERSLVSLSPGERLRAALICLCQRLVPPEVLVLDEPTEHLDFVGVDALRSVLSAWAGGLVIVSHDDEFLEEIRIDQRLRLGPSRA